MTTTTTWSRCGTGAAAARCAGPASPATHDAARQPRATRCSAKAVFTMTSCGLSEPRQHAAGESLVILDLVVDLRRHADAGAPAERVHGDLDAVLEQERVAQLLALPARRPHPGGQEHGRHGADVLLAHPQLGAPA